VTVSIPQVATSQLVAFVLVATRLGTLFAIAPAFSSQLIPARVKLAAAVAFSFVIMPLATKGQPIPTDAGSVIVLVAKEAVTGLAFALALALVGAAVQLGAQLIDTLVGFSFASLVDPINNSQNAIFGQLYTLFATMVFLLTGGDGMMIQGIAASYRLLPIGQVPKPAALAQLFTNGLGQMAVAGLEIAAPVLVALLVADAAFAIVARAVPQMNVFVVGLPAKILLAFSIIGASLPFVSNSIQAQMQAAVEQALRAIGAG
jgi:flagellar biosynthetic protein FliR